MKCDLCKHRAVDSKSKLPCANCAEMIQRLLVVQEQIDFIEPHKTASAAEPSVNRVRWWNSASV
jgi:hypothetical protein